MKFQVSIATTIASIMTLCHSFTLLPPTGPFSVGSKAYVLPKITINDPVAPNSTGTFVLLNMYYPTRRKASLSKYIWNGMSTLYDEYYDIPDGSFRNLTARVSYNADSLAPRDWKKLNLPTLIFNPPFAGPPSQLFLGLFSDLVSHGYSVVTMDHPYEQPYLLLPNGTGVPGLPFDYDFNSEEGFELVQHVHDYRLSDAAAVLDALPTISKTLSIPLNTTHFSFFGHSLGGSAALSQPIYERNHTPKQKHTIIGALNMDGSLWDPVAANDSTVNLRIPTLVLSSSGHRSDPQFAGFDAQQSSWAKEINIGGKTNHSDFADYIVIKQGLGLAGGEGAMSAERMINITRTLVGDFQGLVRGKEEGVLSGTEEVRDAWPELEWLYNSTGSGLV